MAITAQDVNKLRKETGAGMMDCKKALQEADGDFEAAIDLLRKKGQKVSASRADRETTEGGIFVETNTAGSEGYLVAISCETDFVAKNDDFQQLGKSILKSAIDNAVSSAEELMAAAMSDGRSVQDHLTDMMGKIGEKLEVAAFERLSGGTVIPYIHSNSKLGVIVALDGANGDQVSEIGRDVAMQIAAMNPVAVDKDGVDSSVVERELAVGREQALAEGKPEAMLDRIAEGKLNKFYKENTLLNQAFVKDNSKTITQVLKDIDGALTVSNFRRVSIGA